MRYSVENLWRRLERLGEHPSHARAGNCLGSYRITEEALHPIFQRRPLYSRRTETPGTAYSLSAPSERDPDVAKDRIIGVRVPPGTIEIRRGAVKLVPSDPLQPDACVQPWPK